MTATQQAAPAAEHATIPGYEGQTFLVGEEIYLRGVEEGDATYVANWRKRVFPVSIARGEQLIADELPKQMGERKYTMMIVRKADEVVVGSIFFELGDPGMQIDLHVGPTFGEAGLRWKAEALSLIVPQTVDENQRPIVWVHLPADEAPVIAAAERIGMRQTARWREMLQREGKRVDRLLYDYPHKDWMATLGDPIETPLERTGTGQPRPVPAKAVIAGDPPKDAVMVGERVYLRPLQKDDAAEDARWSRRETEPHLDIGRFIVSRAFEEGWIGKHLYKEAYPGFIPFAVCLRGNNELIGAVSLFGVDYIDRVAETGSRIFLPAYRESGYGSEAKQLLLEYGFERLGLHMIHSSVLFQNTRSAAALRKQGYREAGRRNWFMHNRGRFENFVLFDLLAAEWRALPRAVRDGS